VEKKTRKSILHGIATVKWSPNNSRHSEIEEDLGTEQLYALSR
jgi:hypothetical protein